MKKKVWLITGCSSGFGRAIALAALKAGDLVGVGARKFEDVKDILDEYPDTALALKLDVTEPSQVKTAVADLADHFGKIDVLVNNAGVGYFGSIEESNEEEVRRMFEINFWGLSNVTREVLPLLRKQRSGHIINIASIGGLTSFPALGYYHATKYAVDGFSETLYKELSSLGIHVTIVAPGAFRTDWAGRSANEAPVQIADYAASAGALREWLRGVNGQQPGDPARAADAILKVVNVANPPLRLLLGVDAVEGAYEKLNVLKTDFDEWRSVSEDVNFV
ncbi:MAG: SDR family NAD(P)-dependent oxidoreductase [Chitinophagaceae bacterium]|nr:SDR family NAD(P)-dependent oxidoreductase [Chitinophagaceae bacterium]